MRHTGNMVNSASALVRVGFESRKANVPRIWKHVYQHQDALVVTRK
jgi:hypothetical protein